MLNSITATLKVMGIFVLLLLAAVGLLTIMDFVSSDTALQTIQDGLLIIGLLTVVGIGIGMLGRPGPPDEDTPKR